MSSYPKALIFIGVVAWNRWLELRSGSGISFLSVLWSVIEVSFRLRHRYWNGTDVGLRRLVMNEKQFTFIV